MTRRKTRLKQLKIEQMERKEHKDAFNKNNQIRNSDRVGERDKINYNEMYSKIKDDLNGQLYLFKNPRENLTREDYKFMKMVYTACENKFYTREFDLSGKISEWHKDIFGF